MKPATNEVKVLTVLVERRDNYSEGFYFQSFAYLQKKTGLERGAVCRACRALARKGLAEFARGLWSEDGEPAGSGYGATKQGAAFITSLEAETTCQSAGNS
jgi:hypothetical protein